MLCFRLCEQLLMKLRKQEQGQGAEEENTLRDTGKAEDQIGQLETGEVGEKKRLEEEQKHFKQEQVEFEERRKELEKERGKFEHEKKKLEEEKKHFKQEQVEFEEKRKELERERGKFEQEEKELEGAKRKFQQEKDEFEEKIKEERRKVEEEKNKVRAEVLEAGVRELREGSHRDADDHLEELRKEMTENNYFIKKLTKEEAENVEVLAAIN